MNTIEIENKINEFVEANSGFDLHRNYLGISHVSGCPRRAYDQYMNGMTVNATAYRMSFAGYDQERSVKRMLASVIAKDALEVVAPFDSRLRGHVDGVTITNDLIEIKSVTVNKFQKIVETNKTAREHFAQVQLYMRYGGFKQAFVIYRCRETYEHKVIRVPYLEDVARRLEEKAKSVLQAIDTKQPPICECGNCR